MFGPSFADIVNNGGRVPSPLDILKRRLRVVLPVLFLAGGITGAVLWVWRETPGSCLILQERYCRLGVKLTTPDGRYGGIGFLLPPGTIVFSPDAGVFSTLGTLTRPSGIKYSRMAVYTAYDESKPFAGPRIDFIGNKLQALVKGGQSRVEQGTSLLRVNKDISDIGLYNLIVLSLSEGISDEGFMKEFMEPGNE